MTIEYAKENGVIVKITNEEEYATMVPLLSTLYNGWHLSKYETYAGNGLPFYISIAGDSIVRGDKYGEEIPVVTVDVFSDTAINNYTLY